MLTNTSVVMMGWRDTGEPRQPITELPARPLINIHENCFCSLWSGGPGGCQRPLGTCLSSAAVLGWTSSLQDSPPACLLSNSFLFLLEAGSSWMCSVPQGSERRRRVHLLARCPPALSSVITRELEVLLLPLLHSSSSTEPLLLHSFFSSCICPQGSDFLLVIRLSICLSSSSSSSPASAP